MNTFIQKKEDLLSLSECSEFIHNFKSKDLSRNTEDINFDGEQNEYKNLDKHSNLKEFHDKVKKVADEQVQEYLRSYPLLRTQYYIESSLLLELEKMKGLKLHYDREIASSHESESGGFERRTFTVLAYLQDIDQGGEIFFPEQKELIKIKAGTFVVFPTFFTHPHMVFPTSQDRYTYRINFYVRNELDEL
jgi:hypothetical protein